jgi:ABC-type microcin C transport system permease subunit YejB
MGTATTFASLEVNIPFGIRRVVATRAASVVLSLCNMIPGLLFSQLLILGATHSYLLQPHRSPPQGEVSESESLGRCVEFSRIHTPMDFIWGLVVQYPVHKKPQAILTRT